MSKASKLVAGAMLIGILSTAPLAQAKGIGGPSFSDIPAAAATQVIKFSVWSFWHWIEWIYYPIQPVQPNRP